MPSTSRLFASIALLAGALGAGCATHYAPDGLSPGATVDDAVRVLGAPTGRHAVTGGERLEYARGPFGKHTYMLDFDSSGQLKSWEQVLTEPHFHEVRAGMTRDDLRAALGRPSETSRLAIQERTVWSYRYDTPFCSWFQVVLDARSTVSETGYGPDPLCDAAVSDGM